MAADWDPLAASLDQMEAPQAIRDRVQALLQHYVALGFKDLEGVVSERIDENGNRDYQSLWLFNGYATMEAVISESDGDDLDGAPIRGRLVRWAIQSRDYDFRAAMPESRVHIQIWYTDNLWGELNATAENCDRLTSIMRRFILPETTPAGGAAPATSPS